MNTIIISQRNLIIPTLVRKPTDQFKNHSVNTKVPLISPLNNKTVSDFTEKANFFNDFLHTNQ